MQSSHITSGHISKGNEINIPKRQYTQTHIYCSTIYRSKKNGISLGSRHWMDGLLIHNRVLCSHKEGGNHTIYRKGNGNGAYYGNQNQPDTVKQALDVLSHIWAFKSVYLTALPQLVKSEKGICMEISDLICSVHVSYSYVNIIGNSAIWKIKTC